MTQITLPDEFAKQITSAAILSAIGPEARGVLIAQAIEYLVAPPRSRKDGYRDVPSPSIIETAFQTALDALATPEVTATLQAHFQPILDNFLAADALTYDALGQKVTLTIFEHLVDSARNGSRF
jgi:hypothetical protein